MPMRQAAWEKGLENVADVPGIDPDACVRQVTAMIPFHRASNE